MSNKGKEARRHVEACLEEFNVARPYTFGVTGGSHQDVRFAYAGQQVRFIFPGSYSDHRAMKNARSALRCVLRETYEKRNPNAFSPSAKSFQAATRLVAPAKA